MLTFSANHDISPWLFAHLVAFLCDSFFFLQLDTKAESELKAEDDEDYAMNSESYLEVRFFTDRLFLHCRA